MDKWNKKNLFYKFYWKVVFDICSNSIIFYFSFGTIHTKFKTRIFKKLNNRIFPKLIKEKRFSNLTRDLTIFVEKSQKDGFLEGIYIKEKINSKESKVIIASKGKLIKNENEGGFNFKLFDGNITTIDSKGSINLKFEESVYELSKINSKIRKDNKLNEIKSLYLFKCLKKFIEKRKDEKLRCGFENSFLIKDIYEEIFKRMINPIYIIILSLISSLLILKPKVPLFQKYFKFLLFIIGFSIILLSELSYRFIFLTFTSELIFIFLPLIFIFIFYIILLIKTKFKFRYL